MIDELIEDSMRHSIARRTSPVAAASLSASLLVAAAVLATPSAAHAQQRSSNCVQRAVELDDGEAQAASLLETLWAAIANAWDSGRTHDKRVLREFKDILLDTVAAKEALSSRLSAFETSPSSASWNDVQQALKAALKQLEGMSRRLQDSVRDTALADTEVFSSLKLAVKAKQEIGRCSFGLTQPTSPDELASLKASHRKLDERIAELRALDKKINEFLQARD